jgi:hypothetical protein
MSSRRRMESSWFLRSRLQPPIRRSAGKRSRLQTRLRFHSWQEAAVSDTAALLCRGPAPASKEAGDGLCLNAFSLLCCERRCGSAGFATRLRSSVSLLRKSPEETAPQLLPLSSHSLAPSAFRLPLGWTGTPRRPVGPARGALGAPRSEPPGSPASPADRRGRTRDRAS